MTGGLQFISFEVYQGSLVVEMRLDVYMQCVESAVVAAAVASKMMMMTMMTRRLFLV